MKVWIFSIGLFKYNNLENVLFKNNEFKFLINEKIQNSLFENNDELFIKDSSNRLIARGLIKSIEKSNFLNVRIIEVDLYSQSNIRNFEKEKISKLISFKLKGEMIQLLTGDEASYVRRFWYAHYDISKKEINTRFTLVDSIEEIKKNMKRFDVDLQKYDNLRKELKRFQQWYYIHEDGLIAPSKFIGYKDMNGILYVDKDAIAWTDGRDTEHCLSKWFVPYSNKALENYIKEHFGNPLRKNFKINVLESELSIIEKRFKKSIETFKLPILKPNNRDREFKKYSDELKGEILYEHLVNSKTHRWLDENILGIKSGNTKGRNSANILYYLGMKADYRGIFKERSIDNVINILENSNQDYSVAIKLLKTLKYEELSNAIDLDIEAEKTEDGYGIEGKSRDYYGKRYERNARNRMLAIQEHGLSCKACKFNFETVYGERGKDFIEVHHIQPLNTLTRAMKINPKTDLIPLCSNCHRMIHRRKDKVLTLNELIMILEK